MKKSLPFLFIIFTIAAFSQESPNAKFGKISANDLGKRSYEIDTGASAVILFTNGSTKIKGNGKESLLSHEFKTFTRIHILNKNGYKYTTIEIPVYKDGPDEEKLSDLKASTYNLENGKVVETKVDKSSIFKEKISKNWIVNKFTFPNVKEGSIIELEYQVTSDFLFNLHPWSFQGEIPRLWSEYAVAMPQFLNYILISQGNRAYDIYDSKDKTGSFTVDQEKEGPYGTSLEKDRISITCGITEFRWAMKNVPAMKEEAYTSTPKNYVAKIDFQLSGYQAPFVEKKVMTTWADLTDGLLKRDDFGMQVDDAVSWVSSYIQPVIQGAATETERARKIYTYVRDQFTCTDHNERYTEQPLKNLFKNRNGNVAEINLLLTAMLRSAGINADPVILSTKSNGFVYAKYPIIGKFNYVITQAKLDGKDILLDASQPYLGFARLDYDCYNGSARVISQTAPELTLSADNLSENDIVTINLINDRTNGWTGKVEHTQGYYGSLATRRKIKSSGQEALFKDIATELGNDITIEQPVIDSLDRYESPVTLKYNIKSGQELADIVYLDPIMAERHKINPFKSTDRQYPVEMPYKINELYILTLTIPDGYVADEIPKSVLIKLDPSGSNIFEYRISQSGNIISLRTKLQINQTLFQSSEYDALREFFNQVVAKQNEQIVFKKKK